MRNPVHLVLLTFLLLARNIAAQPGTLDLSFGTDGIASTVIDGLDASDEVRAVAVGSDGKIIVAGYVFPQSQLSQAFLVRFLPNGSLDVNYGSGGVVHFIPPSGTLQINDMVLQADGKAVVAGANGSAASTVTQDAWFARFNADGTLDATFGNGGQLSIALSANTDYVGHLAIAPDGGVYGLAYTGAPGSATSCLIKLTASGQPDNGFNGNGRRSNVFSPTAPQSIGGLAVRSDGVVFAVGQSGGPKLAALLPTGAYDSAFGISGIVAFNPVVSAGRFTGVVIRPDGKLLVTGHNPQSTPRVIHATQFLPNGELDTSFGNSGVMQFFDGTMNIATRMTAPALYPDGRLIVAWNGFNEETEDMDHSVSWFTAGGTLHAFGTVLTDIGPVPIDQDQAWDIAIDPNGDVIAAASYVDNFKRMALLRFTGDLTTRVTSEQGTFRLRTYPVPASWDLKIELPDARIAERILVRDATGREVTVPMEVRSGQLHLNVSTVPRGVYTAEVVVDGQLWMAPFVVAE